MGKFGFVFGTCTSLTRDPPRLSLGWPLKRRAGMIFLRASMGLTDFDLGHGGIAMAAE